MVYMPHSTADGLPPAEKRSPAIAIPSKRPHNSSPGTATSCGCRCGGCSCTFCFTHGRISIPDSNRETYGGQGTRINALSHNSLGINACSLEAQDLRNIIVVSPSLELLNKLNEDTPAQLAEARTAQYVDDMDNAPWRHFLSEPSVTGDAVEASGLFFGPIELEGSMENNPVTGGSRSTLSPHMSEISVRNDAASVVVQHAGAALGAARPTPGNEPNPFLKLL